MSRRTPWGRWRAAREPLAPLERRPRRRLERARSDADDEDGEKFRSIRPQCVLLPTTGIICRALEDCDCVNQVAEQGSFGKPIQPHCSSASRHDSKQCTAFYPLFHIMHQPVKIDHLAIDELGEACFREPTNIAYEVRKALCESANEHHCLPSSGSASPAMANSPSPPQADDDDDDEFEVSAITSSDGTRLKPTAPPATAADLLGVGDYADSGSDSSDASESDSEGGNEAPPRPRPSTKTNGVRPEETSGGLPDGEAVVEPPLKRKRVHFAVSDAETAVKEAPVLDPVVPAGAGADEEDDAELEAALAAFEAEVGGVGEDKDERDVDLAEAEDAREQAVQEELRKRVERMRARLRGEMGERAEGAKLKVGGEEIKIKVRERKNKEEVQEEEESDGEIDLMRDWTQFIE